MRVWKLGAREEGNAEREITDFGMREDKNIPAGFTGVLLMPHLWLPPQQQQVRTWGDGNVASLYTSVSVIVKKNERCSF
jgi:hypothetical protein